MSEFDQQNQKENKSANRAQVSDQVGGDKITVGDVTNVEAFAAGRGAIAISIGGPGHERLTLTKERIEEMRLAYLGAVRKSWEKIDGVSSGKRISLEKVYVMVQALRSERHENEADRSDIVRSGERELHSGLRARMMQPLGTGAISDTDDSLPPPEPLTKALQAQRYMVLLGEPGSGKSVSLQYVGFSFAAKDGAPRATSGLDEDRIPILLPLRSYSKQLQSESLVNALANELYDRIVLEIKHGTSTDESARRLKQEALACILLWSLRGQLAVLLDGLDEIQKSEAHGIVESIRGFANSKLGKRCRILVASRTAGYRNDLGEPFREYVLKPFSKEEAVPYMASWMAALKPEAYEQAEVAEGRAVSLIAEMERGSSLEHILDNPLLLQMIVVNDLSLGAEEIVANRFGLYDLFIHDTARERARERGAEEELLEQVDTALGLLAWTMHMTGTTSFDRLADLLYSANIKRPREMLDMLREKMGLLIYDGPPIKRQVYFAHYTFQEFLVAWRLKQMWLKDSGEVWDLLRPRLHLSDWREPIFLLASSLNETESEELVLRVLNAGSPYERDLHRDLYLAATLVKRGYGASEKVKGKILKKVGWLLSHRRWWIRDAVIGIPLLAGLSVPMLLVVSGRLSWWMALLLALLYVGSCFAAFMAADAGYLPRFAGFFWWASRVLGGPGSESELYSIIGNMPQYKLLAVPRLIRPSRDGGYSVRGGGLLAGDFFSDDDPPSVRDEAAELLGWNKGAQEVPVLIDDLENGKASERRQAAETLGKKGDAQAVPALINALEDDNFAVRSHVVEALGKIGDARAVPALIEVMEHDVQEMGSWAAAALGEIADPLALQPLIEVLQSEDAIRATRYRAAEALGEIGDARAVPALVWALESDPWDDAMELIANVTRSAARALAKIGDPAAIPTIIEHLQKIGSDYAAEVMEEFGEAAVPALVQVLSDENLRVRSWAVKALAGIGEPAIGDLIMALSDHNWLVAINAAEALGKIGDPAVPALTEILEGDDEAARQAAAVALGIIGDPAALPALMDSLQSDDAWLQENAAEALGALGDERAVPALIQALGGDDAAVRRNAAEALGAIGDTRAVPALMQALESDDSEVRRRAAEALGAIGDEQAIDNLIRLLENERWDVKAIEALGALGSGKAAESLIGILQDSSRRSGQREAAARALGNIGSATAVPALIRYLESGHSVRPSIPARALGQIGDARALPALVRAYQYSDVQWNTWELIERVSGSVDPAAVPELLESLRDGHPRVRRAAAEALGPRAAQLSLAQIQATIPWTRWLSFEGDMYYLFRILADQQAAVQVRGETET